LIYEKNFGLRIAEFVLRIEEALALNVLKKKLES